MTQSLENAITEIVNVLKTVQGLENVPFNPVETMSYSTFAIVYPFSGNVDVSPTGTRKNLHNIAIDVFTKRTDLARNLQTLYPLIDLVSHALLSQISITGTTPGSIFNNSINTFEQLTYTWSVSEYGGIQVVGYHFLMVNVKILVTT